MEGGVRRQAEDIFKAVLECRPERRGALADRLCTPGSAVRAELDSLLAHHEAASSFMERPLAITVASERRWASGAERDTPPPGMPARIGSYRILGALGEGGMGVVYRAEQESPHRIVALKVIRPGLASRSILRRFEHEAQVLGRLQHPGIAQVYEAGAADTGHGTQPFFAMEFIAGRRLTDYALEHGLGVRERLELIAKVCDAIQYAHQKGVIHRDLKPDNIIVDDSGQPKILDFGVAHVTNSDIYVTTLQTDVGKLIGTIPYMSPEQVAGDPHDIDARSDVCALGIIGYELLTGRLPFDLSHKSIPEAVRVMGSDDPTPLGSINREYRGDIETILGKALEKDRDQRYQSAAELAADFRRYLRNEPIAIRPPSAAYQFRKFAQRNRGLVVGGLLLLAVLLTGIVISTWQAVRATRAERLAAERLDQAEIQQAAAERQAAIAQAVNDFLNNDLLSAVDPLNQQGSDVTVLEVLHNASEAIEDRFQEEPLVEAAVRLTLGNTYMSLGQYDSAEPHLVRALAVRQADLGEDHVDSLKSLTLLGHLRVRQGRYLEAEPLLVKNLKLHRRVLGEEDSDTLSAMEVLGVLYRRLGRYHEAEPLYVEVLDARRRVLGDEHRYTIVSMRNLAVLYSALEEYDRAEQLYSEALELGRRVVGDDHPDTLGALSSLATLYRRQGKLAAAEALYVDVVQAQSRLLGEEHPNTLMSMHNLAYVYVRQKRHAEAERLFLEVLEARRRVLTEEHPNTLDTMYALSSIYNSLGQYEKSEPLIREVVAAYRRSLGEEHPSTVSSIAGLAAILRRQGRDGDALPLYQEAIEKRRRALGDDNRRTLHVFRGLVAALIALERFEEVEPLANECYERHARVFGVGDSEYRVAVELLVELYEAWNQPDAAARWRAELPPVTPSRSNED